MGDVREDQGVDDIQYFPTSALHESAEQNEQQPVKDKENYETKVKSLQRRLGQISGVC